MLSIQVNFRTIVKNIATVKKQLKPGTKFCAVVKSNAYGFGIVRISQLIEPYVDCFAVANIAEGITLRHAGIKKDILVFGVSNDIAAAIEHNLIITLNSVDEAMHLAKNNLRPRLHIAVNTGMNRFGLNTVHELRAVLQLLPHAQIEGCYTHLAHEGDDLPKVNQALKHFQKFVYIFKHYYPNALIHAGCSGVINYAPAHFDMLRIGKAMYGGVDGTQTAFVLKSQIVAIKKIKAGATVGYRGEFIAKQAMVVGVVAGGYAHGIQMRFTGAEFVTVGKQPCPMIGRVCMDCFFLDISQIKNPLGKDVTIISPTPGQTLMDVSKKTNLIACNILQGLHCDYCK